MSWVPPLFAAVSKVIVGIGAAVTTVATNIGIPAGIAKLLGAAAVAGIKAGAQIAIAIGLNALLSPKIGAGGSPIAFLPTAQDEPVRYPMGRTAVAGRYVHAATSAGNKNKFLHYFSVLAFAGGTAIAALDAFYANQQLVTFNGAGAVTAGPYAGLMWNSRVLGNTPETYLTAPAGTGTIPEWTSECIASGYAADRWVLQHDMDVYRGAPPDRYWVGRFAAVYDPRKDSTYDGGSGAHRADDETTWEYDPNPYLNGLTFALGRKSGDDVIIGGGLAPTAINIAAFVEGANVCDANGWVMGGEVTSADDKWEALKAILQPGGGQPMRLGGRLTCYVPMERSPVATITGADFTGVVSVPGMITRTLRHNTATPRYRSEDHQWKMVRAAAVSIPAHVAADGRTRTVSVDYPLAQDVDQVTQLAVLGLQDARELAPIVLPLGIQHRGLEPGDLITVNEPEIGLIDQPVLLLTRRIDPTTGLPTFTGRTESPGKMDYALGVSGSAPPFPAVSGGPEDLYVADPPDEGTWAFTGITKVEGTSSVPGLRFTGACEDVNASDVIFETSPDGEAWTQSASLPAQTTTKHEPSLSIPQGSVWYGAVRYRIRGVMSDRLVLGPETAGAFSDGGASADISISPTPEWADASISTSSDPAICACGPQSIGGINVPVQLQVDWDGGAAGEYQLNGGTWLTMTSGTPFTVENGDAVDYRWRRTGSAGTTSGNWTVKNVTESPDVTLSTGTYSATITSGGSGSTPDPVSWDDIVDTYIGQNNDQLMTGYAGSIDLRVTVTGSDFDLYLMKDGIGTLITSSTQDVSVPVDTYVRFEAVLSGTTASGTATVHNHSDGEAVLGETFDITLLGDTG